MDRREIILDNYKNPYHKGLIDDNNYIHSNTNNESCIDEVNLMVKIENNKIVDAYFDGEACAICTSSSSIMLKEIIGKTVDEVNELYNNVINMIDGNEYNEIILNNINVYSDTKNQPNRKLCVLLPWYAVKKIIDKN